MARARAERLSEAIVPVAIKYGRTVAAARQIAWSPEYAEQQYPRESKIDGAIYLVRKNGQPNDLVAAILMSMGVHIPLDLNRANVKRLRSVGVISCGNRTMEYLLVLQDAQDDGMHWREAIVLAECWMAVQGLNLSTAKVPPREERMILR